MGADQPGATTASSYELTLTLPDDYHSGVMDTETREEVTLDLGDDGIIYGQIDDEGTIKTVFTLEVDAQTGEVTLAQLRAVVHDSGTLLDQSETVNLNGTGIIGLKAEILDEDNDPGVRGS